MAGAEGAGCFVLVVYGAAGDDQHAWFLLGHEQGAGGFVGVAHVGYDGVVGVADGGGLAVVGPGVYFGGGGCVEGFAVV